VTALLSNPVLVREMRTRMHGRRAAVLISFWLAFNGAVLAIAYLAAENISEDRFGFGGFANTVAISRGIYEWTLFAMLLLMVLIVPAQAAGAIAGERERQTLIPLQVTLLTPWRILVGKVLASVVFLALLVVVAMPLLAVGYLLGGIGITDVVAGAGAVLLSGLLLAALCIAVSTFVRRVQAATVLSYALVLALTVGTFIAYGAYAVVDESRGPDRADPPDSLLLANPVVLVSDVVGDFQNTELPSPFDGIYRLVNERRAFDVVAMEPDFGPEVARRQDGLPFWIGSLVMLGLLSIAALGLAARRLDTPAETER
jgi:ABC-type transport system involved in multi-copper enzyme maturation permease subunit